MKLQWSLALLLMMACGGQHGTWTLQIVVSPTDDPFAAAAQARITIMSDPVSVKTTNVSAGKFTFDFDQKPMKGKSAPVLVEALDGGGATIAYGQTPALPLDPSNIGPIAVWVARPGAFYPSQTKLPAVLSGIATTSVPGLGVVFAGGADGSGAAQVTASVYFIYTHSVSPAANLTHARVGASAIQGPGLSAIVFGGASDNTGASPAATAELLDPTEVQGVWAPLTGDTVDARSRAAAVRLGSGGGLIAGGFDGNGARLASGVLLTTDSTPRVAALAGTMVAARQGHCMAPAHFPDGDGAFVFGGLPSPPDPAAGSAVAERLLNQSFLAYNTGDLGAQPSRVGATCTTLPDGRVLVVGGQDQAGNVLASGFVVTPNAVPVVDALPAALTTARIGHSASLTGGLVLVCGGADGTGKLQASCDRLDASSGALVDTIPLTLARRDHAAEVLETGVVLIAGGLTDGGLVTQNIELYTPPR